MKTLSTILFVLGLVMMTWSMIFMKSLNYLIPSVVGVIGIMIMGIGIDMKDELTNTDN